MDPNETLRRLRACMDEDDPFNPGELLMTMQEHFRALDEWLSKGGFLPDDWRGEELRAEGRTYDLVTLEPLGGPVPGVNGSVLPEREA